jgi:tellurite resistance protein TehA-like permease
MPMAYILRVLGIVVAAIVPGGSLILVAMLLPRIVRRWRRLQPVPAPAAPPVTEAR